MHIGVVLPVEGDHADRESILAGARTADAAGFHSVWTTDRLLLPTARPDGYPYSKERAAIAFDPDRRWLDPVAVMGMVAGATEHVAIGTNVLVTPYRHPVVLAQEIATLDALSGGRIMLGVGIGWMREEFGAVGIPFGERAPRTDEYIDVMRALWQGEAASHHGRFVDFDAMVLAARPARPGGPPILIGGNSEPALRRTAVRGDGWAGVDLDPAQAAEVVARLRALYAEQERDFGECCVSLKRKLQVDEMQGRPAAAVAAELDAYERAGITLLIYDVMLSDDPVGAISRLADLAVPAERG